MNKAKKLRENQYLWIVILIGICAVAIFWGGQYYISSLRNDLKDQTISNVLTVTSQQQQAFDTFISGDRERLHSFAGYFSGVASENEVGIQERLHAFAEVDAYYTVINLDTGFYYNNRSDEVYRMEGEELESYRLLTWADIRNPYPSLYLDDTAFGYYERFEFSDGVFGLFQKSYSCSRVSEEFSLSFYNDQGHGYVVTRQGEILLRSIGKSGENSFDNIFDMITETSANQAAMNDFIEALERQEKGTAIFGGEQGDYIYAYVPVENAEEWYLVSIVPVNAVMDEADEIIRNSQFAVMVLLIVMLVVFVFVFLVWCSRKVIEERDQEIEYHKQQFDIFSAYLSDNTDDVYMTFDRKGHKVEYVSPNVERIFGISEKEVLKDIEVLGQPRYLSGEKISFEKLDGMKPGDSIKAVFCERIHRKTGERMWFRESVYCVSLRGEEKIVVYFSDRTKERKAQDSLTEALDMAQVANRAKSAFLSNVSHDIRTPLNVITGMVLLLEQEADNPEHVSEYARQINIASQYLLGLINDVLDMNKIEDGGVTLNITEVNMATLIDDLNAMIRPQAKAKNQSFRVFASTFTHEHLLGDKLRINQVLINILSNAVKYTPKGGCIEFHVNELSRTAQGYSRIQFVVRDNGQGMSEDYLKVIFDPFTREKDLNVNEIHGTGIGMAITKKLIDLMDGSIEVDSEEGKGSVFTVEMNLCIRDEEEDDSLFWKDNNISRMIVADADEYICKNIVRAMTGTGVDADYATSGREAVGMMQKEREAGRPYDLMLLDWKMPDLGGLEMARLIRKNYVGKMPVLIFMSYDWSEIEHEAAEVGVAHFMSKPFFRHNFKEAVKRIVDSMADGGEELAGEKKSIVAGKHILVVDDIEVNRMIMVRILNAMGADCDIATNGQEAVDRFAESLLDEYDIILMDVQMPVLNGYEATKAIRASGRLSAKSIAIVAMTANAFADDVREALDSGMDAHVSKPIVLEQLETTLQEVMKRKIND